MRPIYEATVAQIDVSSACHLECSHCTRFVGHHAKNYNMSLQCFEEAIDSLEGFPGRIGIMGGEPTLHPQFSELLAILRKKVPIEKREFWTAGYKWLEYHDEIYETFLPHRVAYNDHSQDTGAHQPLGVAISEVVDDKELMWELIDACPFQAAWSPAITDKGAFFCEIAASQDRVTNGPGGWKVEPGWWDKTPDQFQDQVERYCPNCSGCLPMPKYPDGRGGRDGKTIDVVSPGFLEKLIAAGSPKAKRGQIELWTKKITREDLPDDWNPRGFRDFVAHSPEDVKKAVG